jgi:hypothetical protein
MSPQSPDDSLAPSRDFVLDVMGAFSITKTVLGVYGILPPDSDDAEYGQWVVLLGQLCKDLQFSDSGVDDLAIIWQLREEWLAQGRRVSANQSSMAEKLNRKFGSWIVNTFPCFEQLPDGTARLK